MTKTVKKPRTQTTKSASSKKAKPAAAKSRAVKTSTKVDYYPNRMTFWVSAAAGSILVLISVIVAYS